MIGVQWVCYKIALPAAKRMVGAAAQHTPAPREFIDGAWRVIGSGAPRAARRAAAPAVVAGGAAGVPRAAGTELVCYQKGWDGSMLPPPAGYGPGWGSVLPGGFGYTPAGGPSVFGPGGGGSGLGGVFGPSPGPSIEPRGPVVVTPHDTDGPLTPGVINPPGEPSTPGTEVPPGTPENPVPVPEPEALAILILPALVLAVIRNRRRAA